MAISRCLQGIRRAGARTLWERFWRRTRRPRAATVALGTGGPPGNSWREGRCSCMRGRTMRARWRSRGRSRGIQTMWTRGCIVRGVSAARAVRRTWRSGIWVGPLPFAGSCLGCTCRCAARGGTALGTAPCGRPLWRRPRVYGPAPGCRGDRGWAFSYDLFTVARPGPSCGRLT